ncbi:hypothetical protein [Stygiolobus caldivivus]|uniref:Uncharacterized protein n=1 Tax=Stygiolobus caldivivus TaxID=2824673 RepID=A0A8D5U5C0_9CREN|nr:hypothetical protein [Stygiolobus caldivivus]BCU69350.1 hypothetical protein KN1_06470 [Stygiolobus caldivivus]
MGYKSRLYHIGKWRYYMRSRYYMMMSRKLALKTAKKRWFERILG